MVDFSCVLSLFGCFAFSFGFLGISKSKAINSGFGTQNDQNIEIDEVTFQDINYSSDGFYTPKVSTFTTIKIPKRSRDSIITYEVVSGDTLSTIAEKFEISVNTLKWANGLSGNNPIIQPTQVLKIPQGDGVIHKIATGDTISSIASKYRADKDAIMPANPEVEFAVGNEIFIPGGRPEDPKPVVVPKNQSTSYKIVESSVSVNYDSSNYHWPANGTITQYFGRTNFNSNHTGIDVAAPVGTAIRAAKAGTVKKASWYGGYGYLVIIDHGGGVETYYGHCSSFKVSEGDWVEKGQTIAGMGSTGYSTGSHLHFEIRVNGKPINPLSVTYD